MNKNFIIKQQLSTKTFSQAKSTEDINTNKVDKVKKMATKRRPNLV